jgi:tetratricopeptide (TPR) repeat protein
MKKRPWIRRWFLLGLIPVGVIASEQELTQRFRNAIKDVDRIALWETMAMPDTRPGLLLELRGADLAKSFGEAVEVEKRTEQCLCITSPEIRLYRGEELQFSVTLHHSTRLRDENGPWLGDVELTEASAAKFREWFAQHGYPGFVEGHELMIRAQKEHGEHWAALRALFPDDGKELPGEGEYLGARERDRRISALREKMTDATNRILVCWRGLGLLQEWAAQQHLPVKSFIFDVLKKETSEDFRKALAAISSSDSRALVGAFSNYEEADIYRGYPGENIGLLEAVDDDAFVELVRGKLRHDRDPMTRFVISKLKKQDRPKIRALLVEIAEGKVQGPPRQGERLGNDYWALLALSELNDPRAGAIATAKRKQTSRGKAERLALEVISARFDHTVKLGPEHLTETEGAVADAAWVALGDETDRWSIDLLLSLLKNEENYVLESRVREALGKRGLRRMDNRERLEVRWMKAYRSRIDSLDEVRRAIVELETKPADQNSESEKTALLRRLRYHEGRHLIKLGEYEKARSSLIQADDKDAVEEMVITSLATGRLDEAMVHTRFHEDHASLERRAYVALVRGEFEEAAMDFDAAARLDIVDEAPVLFAHLAYILAGKESRSRLLGWENPFRGGWVLADEDGKEPLFWPETGIIHFQGKMTWAELEASLAESRGGDRAESRYGMSLICRARGDLDGEKTQLTRAVATKDFSSFGYVLALHRQRELAGLGK